MTEFKSNLLPQVFSSLDQPKVRSAGMNEQVDPQTQKEGVFWKAEGDTIPTQDYKWEQGETTKLELFLLQALN